MTQTDISPEAVMPTINTAEIEARLAEARKRQDMNDSGLLAIIVASDFPRTLAALKAETARADNARYSEVEMGRILVETQGELAAVKSQLTAANEKLAAPSSSINYQQRSGVAWDILVEAVNTYDGFMLDDDYNGLGMINSIMGRIKERMALYAPPITGDGNG